MDVLAWSGIISFVTSALVTLAVTLTTLFFKYRLKEKEREIAEVNIHGQKIRFDKKFEIYYSLWVSALELSIKCKRVCIYTEVDRDSDQFKESENEFDDSLEAFSDITYQNQPFYDLEVFEGAENIFDTFLKLKETIKDTTALIPYISNDVYDELLNTLADSIRKDLWGEKPWSKAK